MMIIVVHFLPSLFRQKYLLQLNFFFLFGLILSLIKKKDWSFKHDWLLCCAVHINRLLFCGRVVVVVGVKVVLLLFTTATTTATIDEMLHDSVSPAAYKTLQLAILEEEEEEGEGSCTMCTC
jgi:hypothetical protein